MEKQEMEMKFPVSISSFRFISVSCFSICPVEMDQ